MADNRFVKRKKRDKESRYFDYNLIIIIVFLLVFGLVMIYSTSSYEAYVTFGSASYYFKRQVGATIAGLVIMIVVALIPYHLWEKTAWIAYAVSIILIFLIIPFGYEANGAKRWIRIFGVSMQPAEVAKVGMIIFLACLITKLGKNAGHRRGFWFIMAWSMPICALLWLVTSNLSSAIIIAGIAFLMLFVATPGYKRYVYISLAVLLVAAVAVGLIVANASTAETGELAGYRGARVLAWLDPDAYASGKGFQTLQALYAIGSGGMFGKGLGESMQKLGFLPEAQNDMIFSIICEELGLFGAFALMLLFVILIYKLRDIALDAPDLFGALLVVGVLGHVAIQVILNIAVVTNTIPNTGISLPFISYGGSASFFLLAEMGIVLSVARGMKVKDFG